MPVVVACCCGMTEHGGSPGTRKSVTHPAGHMRWIHDALKRFRMVLQCSQGTPCFWGPLVGVGCRGVANKQKQSFCGSNGGVSGFVPVCVVPWTAISASTCCVFRPALIPVIWAALPCIRSRFCLNRTSCFARALAVAGFVLAACFMSEINLVSSRSSFRSSVSISIQSLNGKLRRRWRHMRGRIRLCLDDEGTATKRA